MVDIDHDKITARRNLDLYLHTNLDLPDLKALLPI